MRMEKIDSIKGFLEVHSRLAENDDSHIPTLVISAGTCGLASGANLLIRAAKKELLQKKLTDKIRLRITGCHGLCAMEPSVLVEPRRTFYPKLRPGDMATIIEAAAKGTVVDSLLFIDPETGERIEKQDDLPFFRKQMRTIISRNEKVDPIRIRDCVQTNVPATVF